ncbi:MAG: glycosyltransferase, partial [Chitinivibrionales bacterium]|nr:glycosyltransferase [Chitinivibrionales bacterium]MBD3394690.1 glycosyltransferase [Chitinivibrionales bacterium]
MKRLRVLMLAYACEPQAGSEAGIGFNIAAGMARHHDVWVITRTRRRCAIEAAGNRPGLHFVYFDYPSWVRPLLGVQLYYYLWLASVLPLCRRLHQKHRFELAHHVTLGRYWTWSPLAWLNVPFVWGPLGGGESAPSGLLKGIGIRAALEEFARAAARRLGEHDPLLRSAMARCSAAIGTTPETVSRLQKLDADTVVLLGHVALNRDEVASLARCSAPPASPVRFISMGRLLFWKGFHLGIEAFARARLTNAQYWIVGEGRQEVQLRSLASQSDMGDRIMFFGGLSRRDALEKLAQCHVLIHPSLHDSGG